ncbi:MAG: sugar transferase [Candidatus Obscuribacterales bacterium]|nr:sugar transferase [Candidatus Obscuribacterales bacterium]
MQNQLENHATTAKSDCCAAKAPSKTQLGLKRLTDLFLSLSAGLALAPLMLLIAIAIKLDSSGPVIFKQRRVGRNGSFFDIYKFRTMRTGTPDLPTDQMLKMPSPITRVGKFLRASSLDELPQIFNVIKDDMSIVGPRPALYNQTQLTELRQSAGVLRFLPGITGWAQVNGRDELPDDVKVKMDKWYCDNWHYFLDWKVIAMTFQTVLSRRGAV